MQPGAIIGDGDRKSWDRRGPMIWDNFSTFRTNCAILTSYIRAASHTCGGFSSVCCHVAWSKRVRVARFLADFSQRWQLIRQGRRTRALRCTFMLWVNGQGEFFRVENFFNFAIWMNKRSARAGCCKRELLRLLSKKTLHSGTELISEFPKEWVIITKILFCSFLLILLVWRVCKSSWKSSTSSSFA